MIFARQVFAGIALCIWALALTPTPSAAQALPEKSLPLDARFSADGTRAELTWPALKKGDHGMVTLRRRVLGEVGRASWKDIVPKAASATRFLDAGTRPGIAYEYQIRRVSQKKIETGNWLMGLDVPADEGGGVALVVVDETVAGPLAAYLDRFALDLVGDGFTVIRHDVPRGDVKASVRDLDKARVLRSWIQEQYNADPFGQHTLILIGHVPVVKSGNSRPDGHEARPQETDLFYADTDGVWRDNGQGVLLHNVIPSDHIEMQVGRVDFANMGPEYGGELALLRAYFDKDHHWRHGRLGDLRQAYGYNKYLIGETNALRNVVGPKAITDGGHHDAGPLHPWLFGVAFGSWKNEDYTKLDPIQTVFSINFGSRKQEFSGRNNAMTAMLAQHWYGLATGWGSRPTWQLQLMALGQSIGYSHLRTVNNGTISRGGEASLEYVPTGDYTWVNPIWVNLLGDPTLRPFPLASVTGLGAELVQGSVRLSWDAGEAADGYRIYRATSRLGPYRALNPSALITEPAFVDAAPVPGAWYMVRAHGLKTVYAGSFYTYAQGAFATVDHMPPTAPDQVFTTPAGQEIRIELAGLDPDSGDKLITSFIKGPDTGHLVQRDGAWVFVPAAGASGRVSIPYSVFDGVASVQGLINIDVLKP